jgi:integrase
MAKPIKLPSGKWRIRWLDENRARRSATYDSLAEADAEQKLKLAQVEEIKRGVRRPTPGPHTFAELCDYWVKHRAAHKRSGSDDVSIIKKHLAPSFGKLELKAVGIVQVDEFKLQRQHLNPKTLANQLTLLISMLRLAVDLGWLLTLPNIKKPKLRLFDHEFRYLRSKEEVQRFLTAAEAEGPGTHALFVTAVYTGLRAGELAGLEWTNIDLKARRIVVERSFSGPTKAGDVRYVPIVDALLPILTSWKEAKAHGVVVFPSEAGTMQQKAGRVFKHVFRRTLEAAGFTPRSETKGYIRFHDLRHTFASHWVMNGHDLFRLQKILGHKDVKMTQRYAHLAPEAFAEDYGVFGSPDPAGSASARPRAVEGAAVIDLAERRRSRKTAS